MKTILLLATVVALGAMTGCETFAGKTTVQQPPNSISDGGSSENTFNPHSGAYDAQAPVGVDNSAAAGR